MYKNHKDICILIVLDKNYNYVKYVASAESAYSHEEDKELSTVVSSPLDCSRVDWRVASEFALTLRSSCNFNNIIKQVTRLTTPSKKSSM